MLEAHYAVAALGAILNALNVTRYPNANRDKNPIESYEKQSRVIAAFSNEKDDPNRKGEPTSFERMIPILTDALYLYDWIGYDAGTRYKEAVPGGSPGSLAIMCSNPEVMGLVEEPAREARNFHSHELQLGVGCERPWRPRPRR
jgi:hypothetical protein